MRSTRVALCAASCLLAALACGGSESTGPSTGSVEVVATTTGAVNGTVTFTQLSVGSHQVALSGVATNCTPSGQNPTFVSVTGGATTHLAVAIACARLEMIAFVSWRDGNGDVYVMNADGTGVKRLTTTTQPASSANPAWSRDGSRIAFASNRDGHEEIYVMNADGSSVSRLTYFNSSFPSWYYSSVPSWSPDGSRIVFASSRDDADALYVMNADGSGISRLTNNPSTVASDAAPVWSPDGSKILFLRVVYGQDNNWDVYVMNADGSGQVNLTNSVGVDECGRPDWSPDGSKIVFAADSFGNGNTCRSAQLYVMNANGTALRRLMSSSAQDMWPSWSPDGTKIAFTSYRDGNQEVYVMNADGTGPIDLTKHPANDLLPAWRP